MPDYTFPVDVIAQTIGNLAVNIAAQTIPNVTVDIAAQSLAALNINIESISSGVVFNVAQSGDWTVNAAQTGVWTINISAPLDAGGNLKTAIMESVQLDVNIAASAVTLNVAIQSSAVTLNVNIESIGEGVVFNVAQSGTWTINAVQSGDWNINIESVSAGVTFNVNITGSTATLDVNIAGQAANVNVDIKAQSVAIKGLTDWAAENATDIDVTGFVQCDSGVICTVVSYTVPSGKTLLIYNWDAALRDGDGQLYCSLYDVNAAVDLGYGGGVRGFSAALSKPIRVAGGHTIRIRARQDSGTSRFIHGHIGGVLL